MADYIDREELLKLTENITFTLSDNATSLKAAAEEAVQRVVQHFHYIILYAPSIDGVEQKHAHWELGYVMSDNDRREFCSNCNYPRFRNNSAYWRYCPYCGAKMDEVTE